MRNGKYSNNSRKRRLRWNRQFVLLVSVIVLLIGMVGGTLAYLTTSTEDVVNTFIPGKADISVEETLDGDTKKDVKIQNNGNVDVIIRAKVVVTWQDDSGNVYYKKPVEGTDYFITWTKAGWSGPTGGYYTHGSVKPGETTGILFTGCAPLEDAPAGYHLVVDIISEATQVGTDGNAKW